ncbi:hypothetical protein GGF47_005434, partial [Coemansia sp. RSA 2524]
TTLLIRRIFGGCCKTCAKCVKARHAKVCACSIRCSFRWTTCRLPKSTRFARCLRMRSICCIVWIRWQRQRSRSTRASLPTSPIQSSTIHLAPALP